MVYEWKQFVLKNISTSDIICKKNRINEQIDSDCKVANEVMVAEPMNDEGMEEERSDEEQGPAVKKLRIRVRSS